MGPLLGQVWARLLQTITAFSHCFNCCRKPKRAFTCNHFSRSGAAVCAQHIRRPRRGAACWISNQIIPDLLQKGLFERIRILGRSRNLPLIPPGGPHMPPFRPQNLRDRGFGRLFSVFFAFQNAFKILHRKKHEKNAKIMDFGLPKPSQNPPKIQPKSRS